jgi:hypothetical protein
MRKIDKIQLYAIDKKAARGLILLVLVFVVLVLIQDFLRADIKNTAFHFSESCMFSSFWWLFARFLFIYTIPGDKINGKKKKPGF